jgi:hypothetical protein
MTKEEWLNLTPSETSDLMNYHVSLEYQKSAALIKK